MPNPTRLSGVAMASCVATLSWVSSIAHSEPTSDAEAGWAAISKCAEIVNEDARHACSDDVMRNAGLLAPAEPVASKSRRIFGLPASQLAAAESPDAAKRPAEAEQLEVTLASVRQGGNGKLVLTTTDGAVWQQVESETLRPEPTQGQTMIVTKASLGGFLCKPSRWVSFRCFRVR